jgi:hypothetical protein
MILGSSQPLTEMSTRGKGRVAGALTTSLPAVSRLSRWMWEPRTSHRSTGLHGLLQGCILHLMDICSNGRWGFIKSRNFFALFVAKQHTDLTIVLTLFECVMPPAAQESPVLSRKQMMTYFCSFSSSVPKYYTSSPSICTNRFLVLVDWVPTVRDRVAWCSLLRADSLEFVSLLKVFWSVTDHSTELFRVFPTSYGTYRGSRVWKNLYVSTHIEHQNIYMLL